MYRDSRVRYKEEEAEDNAKEMAHTSKGLAMELNER